MKKAIFFLLAALFLFINCLPSSIVFADDSGYTYAQYADVGTLMLTSLISSGEATELDFSDYTENEGFDFLVALGELAVTGDPSGLIDQGLTWLGGELDDAYQSLIEDIRAWEHDIAPDLYNWWYNGSQYEYKLEPTNHISRPLKRLLRNSENNNPTPPSQYVSAINRANNNQEYGFFWGNLPSRYTEPDNYYMQFAYPATNGSWFYYYNGQFLALNYPNGLKVSTDMYMSAQPLTLNINYVDGNYIGVISGISNVQLGNYHMPNGNIFNVIYRLVNLTYSSLDNFQSTQSGR